MLDTNKSYFRRIDVAGTGFTVLDRIYTDGDLTDETLGGSCGNVLVSLAMLHRNVAPVIVLGDDNEGARLIDEFSHAGALVGYINRRSDLRSPILAQQIDTSSGQHDFSFVCPKTRVNLPRYQPIGKDELASAAPILTHCRVFYADRLSENILDAMKIASSNGAIIFFEPSAMDQSELFEEALSMVSILKYSEERLGNRLQGLRSNCVRIVTYGAAGLEVCGNGDIIWCDAINAPAILDTCGSGDMVSVGVIDWILTNHFKFHRLEPSKLIQGITAGQRLAAENCAYAGARGLFKKHGADYVREVLRQYSSANYSAATR